MFWKRAFNCTVIWVWVSQQQYRIKLIIKCVYRHHNLSVQSNTNTYDAHSTYACATLNPKKKTSKQRLRASVDRNVCIIHIVMLPMLRRLVMHGSIIFIHKKMSSCSKCAQFVFFLIFQLFLCLLFKYKLCSNFILKEYRFFISNATYGFSCDDFWRTQSYQV